MLQYNMKGNKQWGSILSGLTEYYFDKCFNIFDVKLINSFTVNPGSSTCPA